jgi:glyoxylase-like metal-dependent hydrolase (beta-lactamase superfamily II)
MSKISPDDLADRHDAPSGLHAKDALAIDATPLEDGGTVTVGGLDVEVVHTPGHGGEGVTFDAEGRALLTGDTLFGGGVGRVELGAEAGIEDDGVEGDATALHGSRQRLLERPDDVVVRPAHDPGSPEPSATATLGGVRERNEDLRRNRGDSFGSRSRASRTPRRTPSASSARTWDGCRFPEARWPTSNWDPTAAPRSDR